MRKEVASMAANSSTTVALIKQHLSPHTAQRARVSKMAVSSLAFGVPLGPGAERRAWRRVGAGRVGGRACPAGPGEGGAGVGQDSLQTQVKRVPSDQAA